MSGLQAAAKFLSREGGINGTNRTGSNRHDKGFAAEVRLSDEAGAETIYTYTAQRSRSHGKVC